MCVRESVLGIRLDVLILILAEMNGTHEQASSACLSVFVFLLSIISVQSAC